LPTDEISVSTEQDAADLAAAAICENATISALWSGSVQPPTTIVVGNGTSLTIIGALNSEVDGDSDKQLFNVWETLFLQDLTLSRANTTWRGAAIGGRKGAQLEAHNTIFTYNTAGASGGAVACGADCNLLLENCTFDSNEARRWGGSLFVDGGSFINITDTVFINATSEEGGGINVFRSNGTISTSKFIDCGSTGNGGGVFMQQKSNISLIDCELIDNSCVDAGAGVYCKEGSRLDVSGGTFKNNLAEFGSAIHVVDSDTAANITTSTFTGNVATRSGGAVYSGSKNLNISTSVFNSNTANFGGAVLCSDETNSIFVANNFSNNQAKTRYGGTYVKQLVLLSLVCIMHCAYNCMYCCTPRVLVLHIVNGHDVLPNCCIA
jgi:predicted outer membrane repeat protein